MSRVLFVLGDGDQIRNQIERYLLSGNLKKLSEYSSTLKAAVQEAAENLEVAMGGTIHVAAGDDLIAEVPVQGYSRSKLETIVVDFQRTCGSTLSFGVGPTIEESFVALRVAKSQGGGIVFERGGPHE